MAEDKVYLLTQEAYNKMKEELAWREGEYRDEILSKVSAARAEGDLSENGGYQAAREAQRVNHEQLHNLQTCRSGLGREFDGRAIAELNIDNGHLRCHGEPP